jgi:hypothetical protein
MWHSYELPASDVYSRANVCQRSFLLVRVLNTKTDDNDGNLLLLVCATNIQHEKCYYKQDICNNAVAGEGETRYLPPTPSIFFKNKH